MSRIPEDVQDWLKRVGDGKSIELNDGEKRTLEDMLNHPCFQAAVQRVCRRFAERQNALMGLDPIGNASEMLRIQGELRGVVAVFETIWETANADADG